MKKTNGENGITLIALVVTIVVLLILAGITITYVMADGGIFSSAKQSASATIIAEVNDYASQIQATYMTQYTVKSATGVTPAGDTGVNLVDEKSITAETKYFTKEILQKFFPSDKYTVQDSATLKGDDNAATISGTITVQNKAGTKKYTVTFEKGVITGTTEADVAAGVGG